MSPASHALALLALASQALFARAWVIEPSNMPAVGTSKISLATADSSFVGVAPVYGYPNCDFSSALSIGGQTVKLILDTGSSNNAVAGSTCTACSTAGLKTLYTDNSGQAKTNTITPHYGDGSFFSAYITTGISTTLPGGTGTAATTGAGINIAVMTSETGFFRSACAAFNQGILGLAYQRLALNSEVPLPDSLAAAGMPNGFALQLCAISNNFSPTQRVGSMYLGGYPSSQLAATMVYTPVKTIGYYEVTFSGMSIGSTNLNLNNLATDRHIVDSGTTGFILPSDNYQKVIAAIKAASPLTLTGFTAAQSTSALNTMINGNAITVAASAVQLSTAASATLYVSMPDAKNSGSTIQVPIRPMDYIFVTAPDSAGKVTLEFLIFSSGAASGTGSVVTIMGHPIHMNKVVFYDRVNNQVGFANAVACQYSAVQGDVVAVSADTIDVLAGGATRAVTSGSSTTASPSATPSPGLTPTPTPTHKVRASSTPTPTPTHKAKKKGNNNNNNGAAAKTTADSTTGSSSGTGTASSSSGSSGTATTTTTTGTTTSATSAAAATSASTPAISLVFATVFILMNL